MRYLLIFAMLLMPFMVVSAEELPRTISVSGEAEVRVAPDQVIISMAVINKEKALDAAKASNDKTVKALLSYFTETLKIAPKHIQTDYLSVNPTYFSCNRREELEGECDPLKIHSHNVEKGIQLRLDDLTKYEAVVAKSFELGVNKISNIQFITTELRKHRDKARELAAIAAREKAQAVADTLGMALGKPITINLNNTGWSYRGQRSGSMTQNILQNMGGASMDDGSSSLAVGQINITASVTVSFDIE